MSDKTHHHWAIWTLSFSLIVFSVSIFIDVYLKEYIIETSQSDSMFISTLAAISNLAFLFFPNQVFLLAYEYLTPVGLAAGNFWLCLITIFLIFNISKRVGVAKTLMAYVLMSALMTVFAVATF